MTIDEEIEVLIRELIEEHLMDHDVREAALANLIHVEDLHAQAAEQGPLRHLI